MSRSVKLENREMRHSVFFFVVNASKPLLFYYNQFHFIFIPLWDLVLFTCPTFATAITNPRELVLMFSQKSPSVGASRKMKERSRYFFSRSSWYELEQHKRSEEKRSQSFFFHCTGVFMNMKIFFSRSDRSRKFTFTNPLFFLSFSRILLSPV